MGTFELVLFLIAAVLLSSLLSQISNKISTPLVQIALGIVIALFIQTPVQVTLDPELFLVLFIAPLLFKEAKEVDRLGFWQNRGMILSLALGLVIATTFAIGFAVNAVNPVIPLAVALALGAALGPTDAVAVSSMSSTAALSPKQKSILGGESLINDASGLVAFQFAIAAALTGEFSLAEAGEHFAIEFFGGLALGAVLGWACNVFIGFVRNHGLENRTFHVLFEVALPFAAFMLGDSVGVSGVLVVVACGIVFSISHKQAGSEIAKMNIVSSSVWDVVAFALNGIVFVLLGMMLPGGMMTQLEDQISEVDFTLIGAALLAALIVIACRFVWVLLVERVFGSADEIDKGLLRHAAIISLAGAKGAITLSIAMTIPFSIACRDQVIFIASVAILTTLLLANFIVPVLAPAKAASDTEKHDAEFKAYRGVLRKVMDRLTDEMTETSGFETMAYQVIIGEYNQRLEKLSEKHGVESNESLTELRVEALYWQEMKATSMRDSGEVSREVADEMIGKLQKKSERLRKKGRNELGGISSSVRSVRTAFRSILRSLGLQRVPRTEEGEELAKLQIECRRHVLTRLMEMESADGYNQEDVAVLIVEYQKSLRDAKATAPSVTQFIKSADIADDIRMKAFRYEQELVSEAYSDGKIDRQSANMLRRQISAMQLDVADEI